MTPTDHRLKCVRLKKLPDEDSFGLVLNEGGRIVLVDEASPAARAGLQQLDLVLRCDGEPTDHTRIQPQVADRAEVELEISRAPEGDLCAIAAEEGVEEWSLWEAAVISCVEGELEILVAAMHALADVVDDEQNVLARRLTGLESRAMSAFHGVQLRPGQQLLHVAMMYGHDELVELLSFAFSDSALAGEADLDKTAPDEALRVAALAEDVSLAHLSFGHDTADGSSHSTSSFEHVSGSASPLPVSPLRPPALRWSGGSRRSSTSSEAAGGSRRESGDGLVNDRGASTAGLRSGDAPAEVDGEEVATPPDVDSEDMHGGTSDTLAHSPPIHARAAHQQRMDQTAEAPIIDLSSGSRLAPLEAGSLGRRTEPDMELLL